MTFSTLLKSKVKKPTLDRESRRTPTGRMVFTVLGAVAELELIA
jgi:hypothetical protein